ncbi:MAG: efflux RND transporter periplasmic adaptor subunit [Sphingobacteriia bacterium]|nr:efflux RND transporter periplasmic adaptor subunit [Sphingobacteriia bacterium]
MQYRIVNKLLYFFNVIKEKFNILKTWQKILSILIIIFILISVSKKILRQSENLSELNDEVTVKVAEIKLEDSDVSFLGYGFIEANNKVSLKAEEEGKVTEIIIDEGNKVNKGDLIAKLDIRDFELKLQEAEANLRKKRIELDSVRALKAKGLSSNSTFAEAEASFEGAQANLAHAQRMYENRFIKAPFNGILSKLNLKVGQIISDMQEIGEIITTEAYKVRLGVSEKYIKNIKDGNKAVVSLKDGIKLNAYVSFVSQVIESESKTFPVDVTIINNEEKLYDGMVATVKITYDKVKAYKVPSSSLTLNDEGELVIKIVRNNHIENLKVEIVGEEEDNVIITGDLPEKATLIIMGQNFVTSNSSVKISK